MNTDQLVKNVERLNPRAFIPASYGLLAQFDAEAAAALDSRLVELIRIRVSGVNGCAYCVNAHSASALSLGETPERLLLLSAWREAPVFTARERAALALADEGTELGSRGVSDATWEEAAHVFSEDELARIVAIIASINAWNRLAVITQKQFA